MSRKKSDPRPVRTEPSLEQWAALYGAAGKLKKLAPWKVLGDQDVLVLQLPGQKEPVYCSVMGQEGENCGVSVYPGHESFARRRRLIDGDGHSREMLLLEQKCLACYFGDREETKARDRAVIKQLGLRFRGRKQWIYFRSMLPGQFPWYPDAEQAELLMSALENLAVLCLCCTEGEGGADFAGGETLSRRYDPESGQWVNEVIPMPVPKLEMALDLQDEEMLSSLRQAEKTDARLELDSFYFPMVVQEERRSPPVGIHMGLLVDRDAGFLLDQNVAGPDDPDYVVAPSMLVDFIEEHGRPAAVYVRSQWMGSLLRNICGAIDVQLVEGEGVPVLDGLLDNLLGSFFDGAPAQGGSQ